MKKKKNTQDDSISEEEILKPARTLKNKIELYLLSIGEEEL